VSVTVQAVKLGLKPGQRVWLDAAPESWALEDPPPIELADEGPADVIVAFVRSRAELSARLPDLIPRIFPAGALWIAWPRRAAGHVSDLGDAAVREAGLAAGVVDVKVAAIDDDWSALKFVWRLADRKATP
jgi:hypothetical protein